MNLGKFNREIKARKHQLEHIHELIAPVYAELPPIRFGLPEPHRLPKVVPIERATNHFLALMTGLEYPQRKFVSLYYDIPNEEDSCANECGNYRRIELTPHNCTVKKSSICFTVTVHAEGGALNPGYLAIGTEASESGKLLWIQSFKSFGKTARHPLLLGDSLELAGEIKLI